MISRPPAFERPADAAAAAGAGALADADTSGLAVPGTTPSCSAFRQNASNSCPAACGCACQNSRTASYAVRAGRFVNSVATSCPDHPPYSGAMSGWTIEAVPS